MDELFCPYYKILTAFNGKEAFDLCLSQIPSLVISDIYMPEMNGIELCSAIKSTKRDFTYSCNSSNGKDI